VEAKSKEQRAQELQKKAFNYKKSIQYLNLYVKGFDFTTTDDELEAFFSEFGEVKNVKIVPGCGFGFVSFHDRESAKNAKEQASARFFKGKNLMVNYC